MSPSRTQSDELEILRVVRTLELRAASKLYVDTYLAH